MLVYFLSIQFHRKNFTIYLVNFNLNYVLVFVLQCFNNLKSIRVQSLSWANLRFLQFSLEGSWFPKRFKILKLHQIWSIFLPKVRILVLRVSDLWAEVRGWDGPAFLQIRAGVLPGGGPAAWPGAAGSPGDTRSPPGLRCQQQVSIRPRPPRPFPT